LVKRSIRFYMMYETLDITSEWIRSLVDWLIIERALRYRDDLLMIVRLTKMIERLASETITLPSSESLKKLREEIEELKKQRVEVALKIPKRIEKELKAWIKEREETKKALERCKKKIEKYVS